MTCIDMLFIIKINNYYFFSFASTNVRMVNTEFNNSSLILSFYIKFGVRGKRNKRHHQWSYSYKTENGKLKIFFVFFLEIDMLKYVPSVFYF